MTHLFIKACYNQPRERTPIWIMRQAGRYMEEYRAIRKKHDFWTVCRTPELACEVTMQPIDKIGVDAAILFSDILVGLPAMGLDVAFNPGPTLANPVRTEADIEALRIPDPETDLKFVLTAIGAVRKTLLDRVPLIGFCGAPLTLAAYMIEGGGSKNFTHLKGLLYEKRDWAHKLMDLLVKAQSEYLKAQIAAGAQAVQIFDTWGGSMTRALAEEFIIPHITRLIAEIKTPGVPVIYFMKNAAHCFDLLQKTGADVLSIDDKTPLDRAAAAIGAGPALQGNLDSTMLFGAKETITEGVQQVLSSVPADRGHVFNLGHGILPETPVENVIHLVETVKALSRKEETAK